MIEAFGGECSEAEIVRLIDLANNHWEQAHHHGNGPAARSAVSAGVATPALERIVEGLAAAHTVNNGFSMIAGSHGMLHGEKVAMGPHTQLASKDSLKLKSTTFLSTAKGWGTPHPCPSWE